MIRIAIVEDDRNDMQILLNYLNRYEQENSTHFQITTFSDGLDIISGYKAEYDMIFLDIQMKHLDGMSTVSYTHLDVYKRQALWRSRSGRSMQDH